MNVAVIIPAYNAAAFIAEALASVVAQSVAASEIVVVDDGSTDATAAMVAPFSAVSLIAQVNAGVSAARNRGADGTRAEWLLFLDADDRLRPDAIERLTERAAAGAPGVVYGQTVNFDAAATERAPVGSAICEGPPPAAARANFWKTAIATPGAAMIRADLLREIGGFAPRFNTAADRDVWIKAGALAEFAFVPAVIVERRLHSANMFSDLHRARRQAVEVQLGVLEWGEERGLDPEFFGATTAEIIERNLTRALETRQFAAAAWICAEATRRGLASPLVARARRLQAMPGFARELELKVRELLHR